MDRLRPYVCQLQIIGILIKKNFVCGCGDGISTRCDSILYSMLSPDCTFELKSQSNTSRDDNYCEVDVDVDGSTKMQ